MTFYQALMRKLGGRNNNLPSKLEIKLSNNLRLTP